MKPWSARDFARLSPSGLWTLNLRFTMRLTPTFLLIAATAASAAAQDIRPAPDSVPAVRVAIFPSPQTATWLSVGVTLAPLALRSFSGSGADPYGGSLATLALLVGPAAGYWYGGVPGKAWPGLLIRTGGLLIASAGAVGCLGDLYVTTCSSGETAAMFGGALIVVGSAIYDIATVGKKVRDHNTQLARAMIVPLFSPSERTVGVRVVIGF